MRAYELTEKIAYYHGSRKRFPNGFILTPQNDGYVMTVGDEDGVENIEQIMERNRPKNMLSRFDSVFMVGDLDEIDAAGGYLTYIYEVDPIGKIEKNNLSWYSEISGFENTPEDLELANNSSQNYWYGIPYSSGGLWEYRSKSAKIIRLVEYNEDEE